jgi:hypothetical protein
MRTLRGLVRRFRGRNLTKEEREATEAVRLERETARLQNRQAAAQAESRAHTQSRSNFLGGGGS